MVTPRTLVRRLVRLVVLVLAVAGARQVLGVWASSVALSAGFVWLVVRALRCLDHRPTGARARVLLPDAIYPHGGPAAAGDRHVAFARALAVVAAAYVAECEQEASHR